MRNWIFSIVCVLVCLGSAQSSTVTVVEKKQKCVLEVASSQVGVRELTGRNDGFEVELYLKSVNRRKGDAWCAAFVSWIYQTCGISSIPISGWSPSFFPRANTIYTRGKSGNQQPIPSDVFGLWFANLNRVAHVGIVEKWGSTHVITIEGNTSDANTGNATREGDGVYRKRRLTRSIYSVSRFI